MGVGHFNQICWAKSLPCLPLSITRASFKGRVAFVCPRRANDYAPADDRHRPREMMTSDPDVTFISKGTALQLLEGHHFSILKLDPAAFRLVCASLSARLSVCLPLSFCISVCLSVSLFDSLFLYFLSLSACLSVSLCLCLYLSLSLCLCLSVCQLLSLSLSLPLSLVVNFFTHIVSDKRPYAQVYIVVTLQTSLCLNLYIRKGLRLLPSAVVFLSSIGTPRHYVSDISVPQYKTAYYVPY